MDYGILEKTDKAAVVPFDVEWNDLGSFDSFHEVLDSDSNCNICESCNIMINAKNNLIYAESGKAVAVIGVENLIVVDTGDALLVCKKEESQKVKEAVKMLKANKDVRIEYALSDYRPWGQYKIIEEEKGRFKIKKIIVMPGKKLSLQVHRHRSEHWIVASGTAKATIDGNEQTLKTGQSIYVSAGQKHRLENNEKERLEIIEVQMGDYLEEDDIVRFDDEYGR